MSVDDLFGLSPESAIGNRLKEELPSELHDRIDRAVDIARGEGGYRLTQDM